MNIRKYNAEIQSIIYLLKAEQEIKNDLVCCWEVRQVKGDDVRVELKHKQLGRLDYFDDVRRVAANKTLLQSISDCDRALVCQMALRAYESHGILQLKGFKHKIRRLLPCWKGGVHSKKVLTEEGKQIELKEALQELYKDSENCDKNIMDIAYLQGRADEKMSSRRL
ncbi:hypothetical protein [Piscirickettsia litoralis]|uniref:Uncharacterized protein n=1 Tax=Piscirickettsia litoralis TaxID=1891921 RepID=A0ABX3A5Y3_9GAMM|nr:hypothetical protein [Piscirickettsia litoralis]ODN41519.1 hypothetical protein BGC07_15540 [Piscirickettsia litoralis]